MKIRDQLKECIEENKPFRFRNVEIYRLDDEGEEVHAIRYKFLIPNNLDKDDKPFVDGSASLIHSWSQDAFNVDALLKVLYRNRHYFNYPLNYIARKLERIKVLDEELYKTFDKKRNKEFSKYLNKKA